MAKGQTHQLPTCEGVKVFCCEMSPAVESDFLGNLVKNGIGALDYSTGASLDSDDAPDNKEAASQSFRVLKELGQNIGYGVVADGNRDNVIVGRTTPPCMTFFEAPGTNAESVTLKGFQFDEYGFVDKNEFEDVFNVVKNRQGIATLTEVRSEETDIEGPGRETLIKAFQRLEENGDIRIPSR